MEVNLDTTIGAMGGCGVAVAFARYAISKALADIVTLSEKVGMIREDLKVIQTRAEKIQEHERQLGEHAKQLARLEAKRTSQM